MNWKKVAVFLVALALFLAFSVACARVKVITPGSLNRPRVVNVVTADQKFGVSFGFVQEIETSQESIEDLYLALNEPQVLERLDKTKSLELRVWIFNPKEASYELQKAVCDFEPPADCIKTSIYKGRDVHKSFQLEAPLTEAGSAKIIRAMLLDGRLPFPTLIIGDGIFIIPKKEVAESNKQP